MRFAAPYRVLSLEPLAPVLVRCSPRVLRLKRLGLQGVRAPGPRETKFCFSGSSLGLQLLFRGQSTEPLHKSLDLPSPGTRTKRAPSCSASHEVSDPCSAFPTQSSGLNWLDLQNPAACASRCSQPPGAFIRPEPAGLVPCRIRSWGQPFRAFFLPRSRTPFPTPWPS
jgi:hypothetical protein